MESGVNLAGVEKEDEEEEEEEGASSLRLAPLLFGGSDENGRNRLTFFEREKMKI